MQQTIQIFLTCYPFEDSKVASFTVNQHTPIIDLLSKLATKVNQLSNLRIPEPRFELLSLDLNIWLDPRKTWYHYNIQHGDLRPIWPIAHGPCDDPDIEFGKWFFKVMTNTKTSAQQRRLIQKFRKMYNKRDSATNMMLLENKYGWWLCKSYDDLFVNLKDKQPLLSQVVNMYELFNKEAFTDVELVNIQ